jgi:hypothetical protein
MSEALEDPPPRAWAAGRFPQAVIPSIGWLRRMLPVEP